MRQNPMRWLSPLVLITALVAAWTGPADASGAGGECGQAAAPSVEDVLGHYVVHSAEKYRGGLTTPGQAEDRVGGEVALTEEVFSIDGRESLRPRYSIECLDVVHAEGGVPTGRERTLGPFHGYGTERAVVWELTVEAGDSGASLAAFEVVPSGDGVELWRLYDGWIYVLAAR